MLVIRTKHFRLGLTPARRSGHTILHHRTRALQNRILVRARLHVCGIRGRCGGAGMCHSHVCITGMSLAGVYYIYYVTIYYVNDKTKNEVPLLPLSLSLSRRFCLGT